MKMLPEHYETIKKHFADAGITAQYLAHHRTFLESPENTRPARDLEMRIRWDAFHKAVPVRFTCDVLYSYCNDDHIDTALRKIVSELV